MPIIEQGEGARGDWRQAHYGRFLGIYEEYRELRQRDPSFEPARRVMAAYSRQPFDIATALPVITDPATAHIAELAGLAYELVLHLLTRFFTHTDETREQLGILVDSAIGVMAGGLRPLASALTTLPVGPSSPGFTTGFAFEMYYAMGNLVPWREPAWALLYERASLLAERARRRSRPTVPMRPSRRPGSRPPRSRPSSPATSRPSSAHATAAAPPTVTRTRRQASRNAHEHKIGEVRASDIEQLRSALHELLQLQGQLRVVVLFGRKQAGAASNPYAAAT